MYGSTVHHSAFAKISGNDLWFAQDIRKKNSSHSKLPPSLSSVGIVSSTIRKSVSLGKPSNGLASTNFLANILDNEFIRYENLFFFTFRYFMVCVVSVDDDCLSCI